MQTSNTRIAVIDLDSVCYSIAHPFKVLDDKGAPVKKDGKFVYIEKTVDEMGVAMNEIMINILEKSEATHYIGYMKGNNTTTRRLSNNPAYKANRSSEPPWWWDGVQFGLHQFWKTIYVDNIEVDDAVNITRLQLQDSFICAIDGDLLGLEGTHYNWRKNEWVTVSKEEAEYKFWEDMIAGQVGDNIKGIPGKGPAYARKIFKDEMGVFTKRNLATRCFAAYLENFGELKGIKEYVANYMSLKILDSYPHFTIPEPIQFKKESVI